jgi:hypothetical protein
MPGHLLDLAASLKTELNESAVITAASLCRRLGYRSDCHAKWQGQVLTRQVKNHDSTEVPVPTAAWSWNPSEQFATPNGAACFNTGGSYAYAHGGTGLQEHLTPVLVVSGGGSYAPAAVITEISWKGLRCNL